MPKAAFMTLGCKVNQFETETMARLFKERGYDIVSFAEKADVYVVNTCSVTHLSESKSRQMIRRARRLNGDAVIAVAGCYAQLSADEVAAIEGVSVVIGTDRRGEIVDCVERAARGKTSVVVDDVSRAGVFEDMPLCGMADDAADFSLEVSNHTRAFLKIEDGCDNFCSYCIIPYARGRVRSRPLDGIRAETASIVRAGFAEIVLTGIHLGAYGRDFADGTNLADAVRVALEQKELKRLRLSSLESVELSDDIFALFARDGRLCPHLHLPLQSGSDAVLQAMNRHYDTKDFAALLEKVRRNIADVAVSTDIIAGFPGETDAMFDESLDFLRSMEFARVHVFPYSPREGTPAAARSDQIPDAKKKERVRAVQEAALESALNYRRRFLGRRMPVLFETEHDGVFDGLTANYIRVYTDTPAKSGELRDVRLEKIFRDGVWGI